MSKKAIPNVIKLFLLLGLDRAIGSISSGHDGEYDFIIVGGGVGGCNVARIISEDRNIKVALIEAGGIPSSELNIPGTFRQSTEFTKSLKVYQSVPQANAGLKNGGIIRFLTGRVLGGGSSVNGMAFNRGNPNDYRTWARITRDNSWDYENMLKYFKRIEEYQGSFPSDQHGYTGPITVSRPRWTPGLEHWLDAGRSLGFPTADPNGPQRISFTPIEFAKRRGRRVSSYTGMLRPILRSRPNLHVILNSSVNRIIFRGNRAVGVQYVTPSPELNSTFIPQRFSIRAKKEVIISAGVIETPVLLMRSGIGPKDVLDPANIPVVKYLPVGHNLNDRTATKLDFIITNLTAAYIPERDLNPANLDLYYRTGDGPYSSHDGSFGQAFLKSSRERSGGLEWADMHLMFLQRSIQNPDVPEVINATQKGEAIVSCGVMLARPKSRGRVTLNVTNPYFGEPMIDFQYLTHPEDMPVMVEGIKTCLKLYEETSLKERLGARYPEVSLKQCAHLKFRSDEYWRCYVRHVTVSPPHGAGTVRMGRGPEDPRAVLYPDLRVIGIDGLRVVDASIMPNVVNSNTHAAVYAIAEKAADVILEQWKLKGVQNRSSP